MKYLWSTIVVNDMEESLKFYQEIVGLPLKQRFAAGPDVELAFLGDGETQIELMRNKSISKANIGQDISLGFKVDSIDKMMEFVREKGLGIHSGPFKPGPNVRFFFVLDPKGLKIQFVENM